MCVWEDERIFHAITVSVCPHIVMRVPVKRDGHTSLISFEKDKTKFVFSLSVPSILFLKHDNSLDGYRRDWEPTHDRKRDFLLVTL